MFESSKKGQNKKKTSIFLDYNTEADPQKISHLKNINSKISSFYYIEGILYDFVLT